MKVENKNSCCLNIKELVTKTILTYNTSYIKF